MPEWRSGGMLFLAPGWGRMVMARSEDDLSEASGNSPQPRGLVDRVTRHPRVVLLLMVGVFAAASFVGAAVAYANFGIVNAHAYDLAIFQQAMSSTVQGFHVPFFESSDCTAKARCSLLLVHPALVLYGLAPFYAIAPSALTLLAARSIIVAAAAIPLYWLARQVTGSTSKALVAAGLYLVWSPTMSGDFYSFHVESFLPLELFTLTALWQARRYRWGLLAAGLSFVTLEVAPIFTFLIGVFFLVPVLPPLLRDAWAAGRTAPGSGFSLDGALRSVGATIRTQLRRLEVRYSLVLMGVSAVAFVALALFMNEFGARLLGVVTPSTPGGLAGLFFQNSAGPVASSAGSVFNPSTFGFTAEYWLILFALLGFLPLLSWRAWVITGPWMVVTFLSTSHRFSRLGSQYTMVALVPLFIGLAYGLAKVSWENRPAPQSAPVPPGVLGTPSATVTRPGPRRAVWLAPLLIAVVAVNLLLNPFCPVIPATVGQLGGPFSPQYFDNLSAVQPGLAWVEQLVNVVPHGQPVEVQNNLLPYLANDLQSYRFHAYNASQIAALPFNASLYPAYVLATPSTLGQAPCTAYNLSQNPNCGGLSGALQDPANYSLRGYVDSTAIGPVLLFEQFYHGPAELFGPVAPLPGPVFTVGNGLVPGGSGLVVTNGSGSSQSILTTNRSVGHPGQLGKVVVGLTTPGNYSLRLSARVAVANGSTGKPTTVVLQFRLAGLTGLVAETNVTAEEIPLGSWTVIRAHFEVSGVIINDQVQVAWQSLEYQVSVASLEWTAA